MSVLMLCCCTNTKDTEQISIEDVEKSKVILFSKFIEQSEEAARFVQLFPESHYYVKTEDENLELYEISITSYFGGRFKITMIQPVVDSGSSKLKILEGLTIRIEEIIKITTLPSERFKLTHGRSWDLRSSEWSEIETIESLIKLIGVENSRPTYGFELYRSHMLDIYSGQSEGHGYDPGT